MFVPNKNLVSERKKLMDCLKTTHYVSNFENAGGSYSLIRITQSLQHTCLSCTGILTSLAILLYIRKKMSVLTSITNGVGC